MTLALSQATLNPYFDYVDSTGARRTEANKVTFNPASYSRCSDLHFLITPAGRAAGPDNKLLPVSAAGPYLTISGFFQVPSGFGNSSTLTPLGNLLNSVGYFIQKNSDQNWRPAVITSALTPYKIRYRLMQLIEPSESNHVYSTYNQASEKATRWQWISDALSTASSTHPLADNIIALVMIPRDPDKNVLSTTDYFYDSRDQSSTTAQTRSQLPPFVEIIMVAIDESAGFRLAQDPSADPLGVGNLFKDMSKLDGPNGDLANLEGTLQTKHYEYRIFRTTVRLDSSRWSK